MLCEVFYYCAHQGEDMQETKTDYKLGQDNITPFGLDIHNPVFLISGISVVAFVIITLMFQEQAAEFFK